MYDFSQAQKVGVFVANSKNVAVRIEKFYRRKSVVIYSPVEISNIRYPISNKNYYLIVSRLVGGKGIEMAVEAAARAGFKLIIAGERAGMSNIQYPISNNVKFVGRVSDEEETRLMAGARGFLALARDEDFGITPVEAQMCGTPVIAFNGGGYRETVIDGKTGVVFDDYSVEGLIGAVREFGRLNGIGQP